MKIITKIFQVINNDNIYYIFTENIPNSNDDNINENVMIKSYANSNGDNFKGDNNKSTANSTCQRNYHNIAISNSPIMATIIPRASMYLTLSLTIMKMAIATAAWTIVTTTVTILRLSANMAINFYNDYDSYIDSYNFFIKKQ